MFTYDQILDAAMAPSRDLNEQLHGRDRATGLLAAVCRRHDANPEDWFPMQEENADRRKSRRSLAAVSRTLCADCPVRPACLETSLREEEHLTLRAWGVRAGFHGAERAPIVRDRRDVPTITGRAAATWKHVQALQAATGTGTDVAVDDLPTRVSPVPAVAVGGEAA